MIYALLNILQPVRFVLFRIQVGFDNFLEDFKIKFNKPVARVRWPHHKTMEINFVLSHEVLFLYSTKLGKVAEGKPIKW